jgi:hypothetical protein
MMPSNKKYQDQDKKCPYTMHWQVDVMHVLVITTQRPKASQQNHKILYMG